MERRLEKLEEKIDKLIDHQGDLNRLLERLTITVETHERRSTTLENELQRVCREDIHPLKIHVDRVNLIISIIKWIGAGSVISVLGFVVKYLKG